MLTPLFPFDEGYMVVCRDRVDGSKPAADVMVKRIARAGAGADAKIGIIFTMSNKRARDVGSKATWDAALVQLKLYLAIE